MLKPATTWFAQKGWDVSPFQRMAWEAFLAGKDGLIHSPTGSGKTLAAIIGPLLERLAEAESSQDTDPIRVIWITPLRALASDTAAALREAVEALGVPFSVALRTGDTSSAEKTKQRKKLPSILVTTPESLTLLLTHQEVLEQFKGLRAVVCDEWHELLASKRGVQTDLALSRLRNLAPNLRVWGVSATLGNVHEAAQALVGPNRPPPELVRGRAEKTIEVECLLPEKVERLAWSGHIGVRLVPLVLERIRQATSTMIFTNTRAQAEIWYRALVLAAPDLLTEL
ncbi:MAG: DEAD/DEAH box helicase, partial [Planctomycetota bacterium]|nr:DEAD/DEAH box helicase [Planctomycetota bacterium]